MRRIILRSILFLLLGVATTVAIAWGFAIATNRTPPGATLVGPTGLQSIAPVQREKVYFGEGEWHSVLRTGTFVGDIVRLDYLGGNPVYQPSIGPGDLPRWTLPRRSPRETYEAITPDRSLHEEAWGWPWRALQSRTWLTNDPRGLKDVESSNGVIISNEIAVSGGFISGRDVRIMPLRPLAFGLILDAIMFAAAWAIAISLLAMIRRRLRARPGLCPQCRYDLRGDPNSGCPECGWHRS